MSAAVYDIIQLQKMQLQELYYIALWYGINWEGKNKQVIIYEILDKQHEGLCHS